MSVVQEIEARAANVTDVLLEVNIAGEDSKSGIAPADGGRVPRRGRGAATRSASAGSCACRRCPPTPRTARPYFARTRELAERLSATWQGTYTFEQLSMGTSADYEVAVQEGRDHRARRQRALLTR